MFYLMMHSTHFIYNYTASDVTKECSYYKFIYQNNPTLSMLSQNTSENKWLSKFCFNGY